MTPDSGDCEPDWIDPPRDQPDDRLWDLRGQGLTAHQLDSIQDVIVRSDLI